MATGEPHMRRTRAWRLAGATALAATVGCGIAAWDANTAARAQRPPTTAADAPTVTPDSMAAAHELLAAMHADANATAMFKGLRGVLVKNIATASKLPETDAAGIVDEVLMPHIQSEMQSFTDMLARIQATVYTIDDMRQLTAFYQSPIGRKVTAATPKIGAMSFAAGQEWAKGVTAKAIAENADELRRRGVKL